MKVLIVDDSYLVRERLKDMICELAGVEIIGEAKNQLEAMDSIKKLNPDVVILDIRLSNGSGINVLKEIKKDQRSTKVIMLTNYPYHEYRMKCTELGADLFFDKSTEFEKISEVLK